MKLPIKIGELAPDENFWTIHTGLYGTVLRVCTGKATGIEVGLEGRDRYEEKILHPDVTVWVDSYGE